MNEEEKKAAQIPNTSKRYPWLVHMDFSKMPNSKEIVTKGGRARTPKKTLALQINGMKRGGINDENLMRFYNVLNDSNFSALEIYKYMDQIKKLCTNPAQMNQLTSNLIQWQKMHHGVKIRSENINVNINPDNDMATKILNSISNNPNNKVINENIIDAEIEDDIE